MHFVLSEYEGSPLGIRLGHATDQKRHLGLIRLRIFKMRWVSVANDHLGPKPLISDSATRRSL